MEAGDRLPGWAGGVAYGYCNRATKLELYVRLGRVDSYECHFHAALHRCLQEVRFGGVTVQGTLLAFNRPI